MRIMFAGGGSGGPVSPLLALAEEFRRRISDATFLWIGTSYGPEQKLVGLYHIDFRSIHCGKLRRYFSWKNFIDLIRLAIGFFQSLVIVIRWRPDWIISAGGYVAVPLIWAGKICRVKILVHQQDVLAGLANKITAPLATLLTVTFPETQVQFKKTSLITGNPVRPDVLAGSRVTAQKLFNLESGVPTLLVTGGGTGAEALNALILAAADKLVTHCQIIHLTGGKSATAFTHQRYHAYDFLTDDMRQAMAIADVVVTRAGMSALTELTALAKPIIIVPIPDSHQEANAKYYKEHEGAIVVRQSMQPEDFAMVVTGLIADLDQQQRLIRSIITIMPTDAERRIVDAILTYV